MMRIIVTLITVLFIGIQTLHASENDSINPTLGKKIVINAGIYAPAKRVRFGFNGALDIHDVSIIDFDKTFKLNGMQGSFIFDIDWRFAKNWSLSSNFFSVSNSRKAELQNDISWNNITFKEGTYVKGGFGMSIVKLFIGRVITKGKKHEIGGGIGLHAFILNGYIEGEALINENEYDYRKSNISAAVPLPDIGLWLFYAPHKRWNLTVRANWFGIKTDSFSGNLWDINAGINFAITKHFGINGSYKYLRTSAGVNNKLWDGDFYMRFQGPVFSLMGYF